jgi:hypothetical protein
VQEPGSPSDYGTLSPDAGVPGDGSALPTMDGSPSPGTPAAAAAAKQKPPTYAAVAGRVAHRPPTTGTSARASSPTGVRGSGGLAPTAARARSWPFLCPARAVRRSARSMWTGHATVVNGWMPADSGSGRRSSIGTLGHARHRLRTRPRRRSPRCIRPSGVLYHRLTADRPRSDGRSINRTYDRKLAESLRCEVFVSVTAGRPRALQSPRRVSRHELLCRRTP